jgi:hypothetical protein
MTNNPELRALTAKWRRHADEVLRDMNAEIMFCDQRTQLRTEARILKRCADQLERVACLSKPGKRL